MAPSAVIAASSVLYKTLTRAVYRCGEKECRKDFTVTVGTVMERSKIALHKWLQAFHLMCSSKKGISAHQLHRTLDITYEAAWFMAHRIREAMRDGGLAPLGGNGGIVEADETYFGDVPEAMRVKSKQRGDRPYTKRGKGGPGGKRAIVSLVERGGRVRSFHSPLPTPPRWRQSSTRTSTARHACTPTKASSTVKVGADFAAHETVNHSAKNTHAAT